MKEIKCLVEDIKDELEGAEHYAKRALQYKHTDRQLADVYAKLAGVESEHVSVLHDQVVRLIKEHKEEGNDVPPAMQAVYDWEHEKMIDNLTRVRSIISMYRGS